MNASVHTWVRYLRVYGRARVYARAHIFHQILLRKCARAGMAIGSTTRKHERVILSIGDKTEVIDMLNYGSSLTAIAAKYSSAKSTVSDIKKNKEKILALKRKMAEMGMSLKAKIVRLGDNYHNNYIIILGENFIFAMLQLSEHFTNPNSPLLKGGRISEEAL